jgi:mRNA interferase MazF
VGKFIKGDVVVLPFPFSDLSSNKHRPALVISPLNGDDVILCAITGMSNDKDIYIISLLQSDFNNGNLDRDSFIRPNKLFTADSKIIVKKKGSLADYKIKEVVAKLTEIIVN